MIQLLLQIGEATPMAENWFTQHLPIVSFITSLVTIVGVILIVAKIWWRQDNRIYNHGKSIIALERNFFDLRTERKECRSAHEQSLKEESKLIWARMEKMVEERMAQIEKVRSEYQEEYREILNVIKEDRSVSKLERQQILNELKDFKRDVGTLSTDFTEFRAFFRGEGHPWE